MMCGFCFHLWALPRPSQVPGGRREPTRCPCHSSSFSGREVQPAPGSTLHCALLPRQASTSATFKGWGASLGRGVGGLSGELIPYKGPQLKRTFQKVLHILHAHSFPKERLACQRHFEGSVTRVSLGEVSRNRARSKGHFSNALVRQHAVPFPIRAPFTAEEEK